MKAGWVVRGGVGWGGVVVGKEGEGRRITSTDRTLSTSVDREIMQALIARSALAMIVRSRKH